MMSWNIFKADKGRKKWSIRGELWDGRFVKLPGHRDRRVVQQMMRNIESLNNSKRLGEPPDGHLADWIAALPEPEAERYVNLGLLDRRFLDKRRCIDDLLVDYLAHLKANNIEESVQPERKVAQIRRVVAALKAGTVFSTLHKDEVVNAIKKMVALEGRRKGELLSQKTRREHLLAMKSFGKWMVCEKRSAINPLSEIIAPSAKGAPVRNRRPMTVADFNKLASYLTHAPAKGANGHSYGWKSKDRLMTYQMAVMTGFRAKELKSLTPASINFAVHPVTVTIEARNAKNKTKATVPIDDDTANALRAYCCGKAANESLLSMPSLGDVTEAFYRDMDGAGVIRCFSDGSVTDFHALRSTAICWWLTINQLDLLEVQFRARLKTLSLVQTYARGYKPCFEKLIRNAPNVFGETYKDAG